MPSTTSWESPVAADTERVRPEASSAARRPTSGGLTLRRGRTAARESDARSGPGIGGGGHGGEPSASPARRPHATAPPPTPFPEGTVRRERPRARGVTEERPLRRETAGFGGVAPGTTGGAIPAARVMPKARSVQQARAAPALRPGRRNVIRGATGDHRRNHTVTRQIERRRGAIWLSAVRSQHAAAHTIEQLKVAPKDMGVDPEQPRPVPLRRLRAGKLRARNRLIGVVGVR